MNLNYLGQFLLFIYTISGCALISEFSFFAGIPTGIAISTVGINICFITAGSENYKSIIKKKGKKNSKIVLLENTKLNTVNVSVYKDLVDSSNDNHDKFGSANNLLGQYNEIKNEIENLKLLLNILYKYG